MKSLKSTLLYESPISDIYQFDGNIIFFNITEIGRILLNELGKVQLNIENFVQRGCVLKSTDYVFGVVTYVGNETKIMWD